MAELHIRSVGKQYGTTAALAELDLDVNDGELMVIVGPSGCGKSTLLRLIAGLESLSSGEIHLAARRIDQLPAPQRDVAMVFQSYALYPHLTVRNNIDFPLRMRGMRPSERAPRIAKVTQLLALDDLLERRPAELSGGQRQRVALARALVREPALFLLDEPLSNLDAPLRAQIRRYIRDLQRQLAVTMIYVTHDHSEAMALGDRIAVLASGKLQQIGTPLQLFEDPATSFVAGFLGSPPMNLLTVARRDNALQIGERWIPAPPKWLSALAQAPQKLILGVRPENIRAQDNGDTLFTVESDPRSVEQLGSETLLQARLGSAQLTAKLPGVVRQVPARLNVSSVDVYLFDAVSGKRLRL